MEIRTEANRLDAQKELTRFDREASDAGAIVSFVGKVRSEQGSVVSLHLDHHPVLTERSMRAIGAAAARHWELEHLLIVHRVGDIGAGEPIVLVAAASRHRRQAFEACDYVVDHLKSRALLWKCETGPAGRTWVETRPSDEEDMARWGDKALGADELLGEPMPRDLSSLPARAASLPEPGLP